MEEIPSAPAVRRAGSGTLPLIIAVICMAALALGLWFHDRRELQDANADHAQTVAALNQALNQARSQMQELNSRLDALTQAQAAPPTSARSAVRAVSASGRKPVARAAVKDPRIDRLQGQLVDTQKQLAQTREEVAQAQKAQEELDGKISSTRDDLSGSIARTHDEVVALGKRGERNIYEFRLDKSKQFQRVGPLSVSLRSTSTKHKTYDLMMMVEDSQLGKKHVNLYEPVWVNLSDRPQPVELVVNRVGKNEIEGYVSEPKYKKSELAASTETPAAPRPQQLQPRPSAK
jgi:uncharacterized coiled-coil protein SlyX